ncbi:DivIVA domain-containing protein [Planotetraspora sp. A-T 1434]|uniref:DivIVA domain-containing protein n=1 Tax=Planotetraspora sp. A-T 1434 TaxID=2979219 RepID=UPI0021C0062B|nr:DivIVA domain-containing protein [Planotetraspora sp. A-T 1434]MCT9929226.1 DivIVA domain-containing protein [Planotetraspora sp. A-T 1434]
MNRFPRVMGVRLGYDPQQVDELIQRIERTLRRAPSEGPPVTADDIRGAKFGVKLGGYNEIAVDFALDAFIVAMESRAAQTETPSALPALPALPGETPGALGAAEPHPPHRADAYKAPVADQVKGPEEVRGPVRDVAVRPADPRPEDAVRPAGPGLPVKGAVPELAKTEFGKTEPEKTESEKTEFEKTGFAKTLEIAPQAQAVRQAGLAPEGATGDPSPARQHGPAGEPAPIRERGSAEGDSPPGRWETEAARVERVAFRPGRFGMGYKEAEVDAFLDRVVATLRGTADRPVTPEQVKNATFATVMFRAGYAISEVDGFLAEIAGILERRA